jgi:hypothetical protein
MAEEKGKTKEELEAEAKAKAEAEAKAKADQALIDEACRAYGIGKDYVFASRVDAATGEVVIVTVGGSKVRFKRGDKPEPLNQIRVTGVNPEAKKRKPITGGGKK